MEHALRHMRDEERILCEHPKGFMMPASPFETAAGYFCGMIDTRDSMRARFGVVKALLELNSSAAVKKALDHLLTCSA